MNPKDPWGPHIITRLIVADCDDGCEGFWIPLNPDQTYMLGEETHDALACLGDTHPTHATHHQIPDRVRHSI